MSAADDGGEAADMIMCCASCGIAEVDNIKLKKCTACKLVRYCSVKCQREHRSQHKKECKKRMAELRNEILFRQPESTHLGDCPICFLPLPLDLTKSRMMSCCGKMICHGCDYTNKMRELKEMLKQTCPFCRHRTPGTEVDNDLIKRIEANDPVALGHMGTKQQDDGNYSSAFEYCTKAANLGDMGAHFNLCAMYAQGHGVEKDDKKKLYHLEEASIGGHVKARFNLGVHEWNLGVNEGIDGSYERATRHFIIAVNFGCDKSLKMLKGSYEHGFVSEDNFTMALRAHQAALDAMKSPQRDAAEEALKNQTFIPTFTVS